MKTKLALVLASALALSGCGYNAVDGELIGQVKKISSVTPIFCSPYLSVDISLGVMRNGTGSMSTQDMWLTISPNVDVKELKRLVESGELVKVKYDTRRWAVCTDDYMLTGFEATK